MRPNSTSQKSASHKTHLLSSTIRLVPRIVFPKDRLDRAIKILARVEDHVTPPSLWWVELTARRPFVEGDYKQVQLVAFVRSTPTTSDGIAGCFNYAATPGLHEPKERKFLIRGQRVD